MNIYVVHYRKLVGRRLALEGRLLEEGLSARFIDWYDRDGLSASDRGLFRRSIDWRRLRRRMPPVQMAISLSHAWCFRDAANAARPTLVLEDDAILAPGFFVALQRCLSELPAVWDLLFLGDGCGLHIPELLRTPGSSVHPKGSEPTAWGGAGATRCTDSYVMSPHAAAALRDDFFSGRRIEQPIDWWMNDAIRRSKLEVFWAEPTIVTQASQLPSEGSSYRR